MTRWQRPPGPLNVWKVMDGYEKLADGTQKPVKFSVQEIPNEDKRKKEVYDLMITYHVPREACSKSLNIMKDPDGICDNKSTFEYAMDYNISVGCYKLDSDGKIAELVGANILFVMTDETLQDLKKMRSSFKSKNFIKIWDFFDRILVNANPFEIFQVDKYIASRGMCVKPAYCGQNLGYHMLNARSAIGKKYEIYATSSFFSSSIGQRQAQRAGFEERGSINYVEYVDDQGNPNFPNMEWKFANIMMKKLP